MGYWEGLLSGFQQRKGFVEAENLRQADLASSREGKVFEALLSSPDPEIQALAATGLLESAKPKARKGGLRGWLGEMQQSPFLSQIQSLVASPVSAEQDVVTPGLASRQTSGYIAEPPGQVSSLAQPETTPVAGDPLTPVAATPRSAIQSRQVAGPRVGRVDRQPVQQPRRVFATPYDVAAQQAEGQYGGRVAGVLEAMRANGVDVTPEVAQQVALELSGFSGYGAGGRTAGLTWAEGNTVPDPSSATGWSQELYLRADPTQRMKIPAQAPLTPDTLAARTTATTTARNTANAARALTSAERAQYTMQLRDDWRVFTVKVRDQRAAVAQMQAAMRGAERGDIAPAAEAMIVLFERALDPDSVVREAEARRPGQFSDLLTRLRGAYDRLTVGGATIPIDELKKYVTLAQEMAFAADALTGAERDRIVRMAGEFGLDPAHIVDMPGAAGGIGTPPPGTTAPRSPGLSTAPATGPPPGAPPRPGAGATLDTPVQGWFVDDQGNLIRR